MRPQAMLEVLLFLGSSGLGIYSMGRLWNAAVNLGGWGSLLWAAVLFVCLFLLGKQIARIQAHQACARKGESR